MLGDGPAAYARPVIRPATPADLADIRRLIVELAIYEREPDAVVASVDDLAAALFPTDRTAAAFCDVAEVDGRVVGLALWFLNFSTWQGKHGIYLEDLFVEPAYRGLGLGKAMLVNLARRCVANGYARFEWFVLDWNAPSIDFYQALGAVPLQEWTVFRVSGDALEALARLDA